MVGGALGASSLLGACTTVSALTDSGPQPFPDLPAELTGVRAEILRIARAEFDSPRPGTFYSQGEGQPWCANFVSWVMDQAGVPFTSPHSGGWRIPGVLTLWAHLREEGRFHAPEEGRTPLPGDIVLYSAGSRRGEHTNLVISHAEGTLTTVGGNEPGGIAVQTFPLDAGGLIGFGRPRPRS